MQVFVHLAYGFSAQRWHRRWTDKKIIGINEPFPYGYYRAEKAGCSIQYSVDKDESRLEKLCRYSLRAILGFDIVHAWRNRAGIRNADVVWTHTESQFLSVLLLLRLAPGPRRPKVLAQSVWLFDRWPRFTKLHHGLFRWLGAQADILTVHSPDNLAKARELFPDTRSEIVLFGICADTKIAPQIKPAKDTLNIISLGNDEHRDWPLLIDAVRDRQNWKLKIASQALSPAALKGAANIDIVQPRSNDELFELFRWADLLVLAIKPNLHASGTTVLQEAALLGVPIVCSDAGGLRSYFSGNEISYVPSGDKAALQEAITRLADDPDARYEQALRAQARMGPEGLSSESFVRRHIEISRQLLDQKP